MAPNLRLCVCLAFSNPIFCITSSSDALAGQTALRSEGDKLSLWFGKHLRQMFYIRTTVLRWLLRAARNHGEANGNNDDECSH